MICGLERFLGGGSSSKKVKPSATTEQDLMHGPIYFSELFGDVLVRKDGSQVDTEESLDGKIVAIFFGASWCPPCHSFTPLLKEIHDAMKKDGEPFEVVLVSSDTSEVDMLNYTKGWLSLPFNSSRKRALEKKYNMTDIPTLIVLRPDGSVITLKGRKDVNDKGKDAYYLWKAETDL